MSLPKDDWFDWARAEWDRLQHVANACREDKETDAAVVAIHALSAEIAAHPAQRAQDVAFKARILGWHAELDDDDRCCSTAAPPMFRSLLADLERLS